MYGGDFLTDTLNSLRYKLFVTSAANTKINLARLPPTEDAARHHAYRTYHQVQKWLGVNKNPTDWGWKLDDQGLTPITITMDPAPQLMISCKCRKCCSGGCSCRKAGLKCSALCRFCVGKLCRNVISLQVEDSDDEEDIPIPTLIERPNEPVPAVQFDNPSNEPAPSSEEDFSRPGPSKQMKLQ